MGAGERLWRVRRESRSLEAVLRADPNTQHVELQFFYQGVLLVGQRFPTRALAEESAAGKLTELQIRGWATHW